MPERSFSVFLIAVAAAALCVVVAAPSSAADPRDTAAQAFDRGVVHFKRAEYAEAARAFLEADGAVANSEALANAMVAAERANEQLLLAEAARRAAARDSTDPDLATRGRSALAEASRKLARVDLGCEPTPCQLLVDGEATAAGERFLLPGTHTVAAAAEGRERAQESFNFEAGARYRIVLHPVAPGEAARAAAVSTEAPRGGPDPGAGASSTTPEKGTKRPLPPAAFYGGAGLTLVLAGVTAISGLDALSAKNDLPADPTRAEADDVRNKASRTDVLLGATVLVGALTAVAGVTWVEWGDARVALGVSNDGGRVGVAGRF